jgi:hypothetical protein
MTGAFNYAAKYSMMTQAVYPYKAIDQNCLYNAGKVTQVKPKG